MTEEQLKEWEEVEEKIVASLANVAPPEGVETKLQILIQAYREQKKEIERLRADAQRLDFMQKHGVDWDGLGGYFHSVGSHGGDSLRECVDNAMKAEVSK